MIIWRHEKRPFKKLPTDTCNSYTWPKILRSKYYWKKIMLSISVMMMMRETNFKIFKLLRFQHSDYWGNDWPPRVYDTNIILITLRRLSHKITSVVLGSKYTYDGRKTKFFSSETISYTNLHFKIGFYFKRQSERQQKISSVNWDSFVVTTNLLRTFSWST